MRNTTAVKNFLYIYHNVWNKEKYYNHKHILYEYKKICTNLLYEDEELVLKVVEILKSNITDWAQKESNVYKNLYGEISKKDLMHKKDWYVQSMLHQSAPMQTNGSMTGKPFPYLRWNNFFSFIECENHYDLILDEFKINNTPKIMYLFDNKEYDNKKIITVKKYTNNFMYNHGIKRNAEIHYANFKMRTNNPKKFFLYLLKYLSKNKINVMLMPGSSTNSLCHYIKKFNYKRKVCDLLSNTNEKILSKDINFLLEKKYVKNICDHMRCWDGGASFFSCKHKNYHLLDNICWCEQGENNKLISTDYFSFPSPFIGYWNGDLCIINSQYKRCDCGRLYRDFELLQSRPFLIKGMMFNEIKLELESLSIEEIKQVRCSSEFIDIISQKSISDTNKIKIRNKFKSQPKFKDIDLRFIVE